MRKPCFALVLLVLLALPAMGQTKAGKKAMKKKDKQTVRLVQMTTPYGDMIIKLHNETPQHRDNFVKLASEGFFDELLFHRVIKDFMIQGGDPGSKTAQPGENLGTGGPGYTVPAEITPELIHRKGALSAARMADQVNPEKASSGSQFYIVQGTRWKASQLEPHAARRGEPYTDEQVEAYGTVGGTPHLDGEYTVFGQVIAGMHVIDQIAKQPTSAMDRPNEDIRMKITVLEPMKWKKVRKTYNLN